jgi:hypothetical protein
VEEILWRAPFGLVVAGCLPFLALFLAVDGRGFDAGRNQTCFARDVLSLKCIQYIAYGATIHKLYEYIY